MKPVNNKWPCCRNPTRLHVDKYKDGDEIERTCPACGVQYKVRFVETNPLGLGVTLRPEFTALSRAGGRPL